MKKLLLLLFAFTAYNLSFSQCTQILFMQILHGIWPDEQTNFMSGDIGVAYQQIVNFKVPTDAGDIDTSFAGVPVDSVVLNNVSNLPPVFLTPVMFHHVLGMETQRMCNH